MKSILLAGVILLAAAGLAEARSHARGAGVHYAGGHHTTSHGGNYAAGRGSSHRGGRYVNRNTGNHYGRHN